MDETPTPPTAASCDAFIAALAATLTQLDKRDPKERTAAFVLGKLHRVLTNVARERTEFGLSDDDLQALAELHATLLAKVEQQRLLQMKPDDTTEH